MLALMRDPQVPLDERIDLAAAAAPFLHTKPKALSRVRTNPMDSRPLKNAPACAVQKPEQDLSTPHTTPERTADGEPDLSPLKFLIAVMNDSEATPKQRIRAARIAARYTHVHLQPDKVASVDEYGFSISRTLAKTIADDWCLLELYESGCLANSEKYVQKASEIYARQAERDQFLQCPPGYSPENDLKRRSELNAKIGKGTASMAEKTEFAYVVARITASEAAFNRSPEGRARLRVKELHARIWMRAAGRAKPLRGLTPEEEQELERLHNEFPSLGPYEPFVPVNRLTVKIFGLEIRCLEGKLTPAEADELEELRRRYPDEAKRTSKWAVQRMARLSDEGAGSSARLRGSCVTGFSPLMSGAEN
jgi:uncharacterized protein YnzC (UPF0291/DUF896 family)